MANKHEGNEAIIDVVEDLCTIDRTEVREPVSPDEDEIVLALVKNEAGTTESANQIDISHHSRIDISHHSLFKCTACPFSTSNVLHFKEHSNIHEINIDCKLYSCMKCNYRCKFEFSYKNHLKRHRERKTFECSLCSFTTDKGESLKEHSQIHLYQCRECDFTTVHKMHLKNHHETSKHPVERRPFYNFALPPKMYRIE